MSSQMSPRMSSVRRPKKEAAMAFAGSWRRGLACTAGSGAKQGGRRLVAQELQYLLRLLVGLGDHGVAGLLQDAGT